MTVHFLGGLGSFCSSRPQYAILGTGILSQMASFERRLQGVAPTPIAVPYPFRTPTWTRKDAERHKREVLFFSCILGGIRPIYFWILAYVELERINKGQYIQSGIISKLASKFLPDDAFFMAASKRLPYRSYYKLLCVVSFQLRVPFGSVGIVLYNQRRMCRQYDSHLDHIRYSGACALETSGMVMTVVSVLLSTTNCSTRYVEKR